MEADRIDVARGVAKDDVQRVHGSNIGQVMRERLSSDECNSSSWRAEGCKPPEFVAGVEARCAPLAIAAR
jgi:hypothetical protein